MNKLSLNFLLALQFILECISYPFFLMGYLVLGNNKDLSKIRLILGAPFFIVGMIIMSPVQIILDLCYPNN